MEGENQNESRVSGSVMVALEVIDLAVWAVMPFFTAKGLVVDGYGFVGGR
ncbi:hypothetical protein HVZ60_17560 [Escherichia coli]|nr:hypothetical protein [Escherichia coli]